MSLPIIVDGEMWGLFAFHHMQEKMLNSNALSSVEILGGSISMLLTNLLQRKRIKSMEHCSSLVSRLFVPDDSVLGFTTYWETASSDFATLIDCDGVALLSLNRYDAYGDSLDKDSVNALADYFDKHCEREQQNKRHPSDKLENSEANAIIALDCLQESLPHLDCGDVAGVLAIRNPVVTCRYLFFFRKSASSAVRWAGKPHKSVESVGSELRLSPRASFQEYIDSNTQRSDPFGADDLMVADSLKIALSRTMSNMTTHAKHRERLGLMVRELNHRVRNILALVGSIVSQSKNSCHDLEDFVHALEHRIQALSETHKLLTEFDWAPIHIKLLFERALLPYHHFLETRIKMQGDDVSLPPELASLFALVIHEMASNASKYGALSNDKGIITLTWYLTDEDLAVSWQEQNGPTVQEPARQGFGTSLIKEALGYEFDAECQLHFAPSGVEAHFNIPHAVSKIDYQKTAKYLALERAKPKAFKALILEDDYVISKEVTQMMKNLGATTVDACPTIHRALECIEHGEYDFALLDANIRGEYSGVVADKLEAIALPFAFATGYGSKNQQLRSKKCIDVLTKPITEVLLMDVLKKAGITEHK